MNKDLSDIDYVAALVRSKCNEIAEFICDKNRKYGNAALNPEGIFSKADPEDQIRVRLDDKLKRVKSAQADDDEDPIWDMIGYFILLQVLREHRKMGADSLPEIPVTIKQYLDAPPYDYAQDNEGES